MHYFGKEGATPVQAAGVALSFAQKGLSRAGKSKEAILLASLLSALPKPVTVDALRILDGQMGLYRLPGAKDLATRTEAVTLSVRTIDCCVRAGSAWEIGNELVAWKLVASAFVSASALLAISIERRSRVRGAEVRKGKDPKQAAKTGARALWGEWQQGKHPGLRTTEQFAIEVLRRWPVLQSSKTVCAWSAAWRKEAGAPSPVS